jgi:hypothetical protein
MIEAERNVRAITGKHNDHVLTQRDRKGVRYLVSVSTAHDNLERNERFAPNRLGQLIT